MDTHINVIGLDCDMIEDSGKARQVGRGIAIVTDECSESNGSRKVKVLPGRVGTHLLEELHEVLSICAGLLVITDAERVGVFPAT